MTAWDIVDETTSRLYRDYFLVDEKGRGIGGCVVVRKIDPSVRWRAEGMEFEVTVHAMRNGECFGASPRPTYHVTEAAAKDYALKAMDNQRARYEKKYRR